MNRRVAAGLGIGVLIAAGAGCHNGGTGLGTPPADAALYPAQASGTVWHVSPAGDDANTGLKGRQALRTFGAAAARLKPGDVCLIHAGVYRETLRPSGDGTMAQPILFRAAPGEAVVLSGLDPVTGWERVDARTFRAPLTWDLAEGNQVFRGGEPLTEARWPNRTGAGLFETEGARVVPETSLFDRLQCPAFPDGWTAEQVKGATVWCLAQWRWSSWTAPITNYDPAARAVLVKGHDNWWVREKHNPGSLPPKWGGKNAFEPAEFVISNARCLLDAPGEWFFDRKEKMLYLAVAEGDDPNRALIEAKRRQTAVDLNGRANIRVQDVQVLGATLAMKEARDCVVSGLRAQHITHTRGGHTLSHISGAEGVYISGRGNVLRDSEIACSAGAGVTLLGVSNALVNCFIHDTDTIGAYACCVNMGGSGHLVSHNTLRNSGRDCLQYAGAGHLIQFNDISGAGRICHDTGAVYQAGADGNNTQICYNWVHGVNTGLGNGIYLDNYTENYLVHHNVIWDISGNAIQLNHPGHYNWIFHNTVFGGIVSTYSPWKGQKTAFGMLLANNLVSRASRMKADSAFTEVASVLHGLPEPLGGFEPVRDVSTAGLDQGVALAGVNDGFRGSAPDCGAYETGQPFWRAGHDFGNPPSPRFEHPGSYYRNYLQNGSFSEQSEGLPARWDIIEGQALALHAPGFNDPPPDGRLSVHANSLRLSGEGGARIGQTVEGLKAGVEFVFAAYVRCERAKDAILRVRTPRGELACARFSATEPAVWRHVEARFRLADAGPVTVEIAKEGAGDAYVDVAGLVPLFTAKE